MTLYPMTNNDPTMKLMHYNWQGLVIPPTWLKAFQNQKGQPNINACLTLSFILDKYLPVMQPSITFRHYGARKQYSGDAPKFNVTTMSNSLGLSRAQIKNALTYLEKVVEIITLETEGRSVIIRLNVSLLLDITFGTDMAHEFSEVVKQHRKQNSTPPEPTVNGSPWKIWEHLNNINTGLNKGQTLKEAKQLLSSHSQSDILACADFLTTDPWLQQQCLPVSTSIIKRRISPWLKQGKPSTLVRKGTSNGSGKKSVAEIMDGF